ncbi:MAG: hypothetical protein PHQ05_10505 [Sterolibacterium sp.]|nr:hypothetical protein [Sterolibacterium sp.]
MDTDCPGFLSGLSLRGERFFIMGRFLLDSKFAAKSAVEESEQQCVEFRGGLAFLGE